MKSLHPLLNSLRTSAFAVMVLASALAHAQDGGLDTGFDPAANDIVQVLALQTVGGEQKVLAGGWFSQIGGGPHNFFARLNANGTEDTSFTGTANDLVTVLSMCADGDILAGGNFTQIGGGSHSRLARLAPNGAHRASFAPSVLDGTSPGEVYAIRELSNGQIVIAGIFTKVSSSNGVFNRTGIALLNADGSVDPGFDAQAGSGDFVHIMALDILPSDGSLVIGGRFSHFNGVPRFGLARLNAATGALIAGFNAGLTSTIELSAIHCRPNGNIVIGGGSSYTFGGGTRNRVAEIDATGALTTWNPALNGLVNSIASQNNGRLLIGGSFSQINSQTRRGLARFKTDGTLDDTFAPLFQLFAPVYSIAVQSNGGIVVGGEFTNVTIGTTTTDRNYIARIHGTAPPSLPEIELRKVADNSLVSLGQLFDLGPAAASASPGAWVSLKIVNTGPGVLNLLPGTGISGVNAGDFSIVGTPPTTVAPNGGSAILTIAFAPSALGTRSAALHILSDDSDEGDVYVNLQGAGYHPSNGEKLDAAFNPNVEGGIVYDIAALPDGKIIIVGSFTSVGGQPRNRIARLNANGTLDTSTPLFNAAADGTIETVAVQADGKLLIGGQFTQINGFTASKLARIYGEDGSLDAFWFPSVDGTVQSIAIESGSTALIGGAFTSVNGSTSLAKLARINLSDTGSASIVTTPAPNGNVRKVLIDSSGRILVGGTFNSIAGVTMNGLARLLANGSPDPAFVNPACDNNVNTIAIQPADGKILIGGHFLNVGGHAAQHLARLHPNGTPDLDFLGQCNDTVHRIEVGTDGKFIVGGSFTAVWSPGWGLWEPAARVLRFILSDGHPDFSFPAQAFSDHVRAIAYQPNGGILLGGAFTLINSTARNNFARIAPLSPDIQVTSTGAITHADGGTRDFGTLLVGGGTSTVVFSLQNVGAAPLTGFAGVGGITLDGANAAAFSLSYPGASTLGIGASTAFFIGFTPQGQGAHEAWLHIHSNDPDEEPFDLKLIGTGGVPITTWRQQNFGSSSNAGNAADDADPDGDGISNLMEFATNGAPTSSNAPPHSVELPDTGFVNYFYARNKLAMAELSFAVEWNDVLSTTGWSSAGVTETILSDNGLTQQVRARVPTGGNDHRFIHLKVIR